MGDDPWAELVRGRYQAAGLETTHLVVHPASGTPVTIVLVDESGERSFVFELGAAADFGAEVCLARRDLFQRSRAVLYGYYALVPTRDAEIATILQAAKAAGCLTALDAAGDGGRLDPLRTILPFCDIYFPSLAEARHQTGLADPAAILACFRAAGAAGIVGLKLGAAGALVSERPGDVRRIAPVAPPGPVVDTTGAGDAFRGGLAAGCLRAPEGEVEDLLRYANAVAALNCRGLGARGGMPTAHEVDDLLFARASFEVLDS